MPTRNPLLLLPVLLTLSAARADATSFGVALSPNDPALTCHATSTPAFTFNSPPQGTKSLAVLFWDQMPDRLSGRWLVFDLPPTTRKLAPVQVNVLGLGGGKVALNDTGHPGYAVICARGRHDIYIDFYALDVASLGVPAGTPLRKVHTLIHQHKLQEAKAHLTVVVK